MKKEEWKPIKGFDGYEVSSFGNIRSSYYGRYIKHGYYKSIATRLCRDYIVFNAYRDKKLHTLKVHRVVCISFHLNLENKPCVNHIDYNKHNNHASNLEWVTHKENNTHRELNGRVKFAKGESHYKTSLTIELVRSIKRDAQTMQPKEVALKYNVPRYTVQNIKRGICWKHVSI